MRLVQILYTWINGYRVVPYCVGYLDKDVHIENSDTYSDLEYYYIHGGHEIRFDLFPCYLLMSK